MRLNLMEIIGELYIENVVLQKQNANLEAQNEELKALLPGKEKEGEQPPKTPE